MGEVCSGRGLKLGGVKWAMFEVGRVWLWEMKV